jgi:hypothetical protein
MDIVEAPRFSGVPTCAAPRHSASDTKAPQICTVRTSLNTELAPAPVLWQLEPQMYGPASVHPTYLVRGYPATSGSIDAIPKENPLRPGASIYRAQAKMAPSLLHPPSHLSPAEALQLSQRAPEVLGTFPSSFSSSPLASLYSSTESAEMWINYENLLLSCLRTGDEQAAHECLERLVKRFGEGNERVMALMGLLKEADANDNAALEKVLKEYDQILQGNSTNIVSAVSQLSRIPSARRSQSP